MTPRKPSLPTGVGGVGQYSVEDAYLALRRFDAEYSEAIEGHLSLMPLTGLGRLEATETEGVFVLRISPDNGVPNRITRFLVKMERIED